MASRHDTAWRPSAELTTIRARAELYDSVRFFFRARGVLEVETPVLSAHATVDRHIDSFSTSDGARTRWLQTSPEFAMKRLLAAGSGPIWQIARVFRRDEQGRHHNPEFSLLEWYRPGLSMPALMDEVAALLQAVGVAGAADCETLSYRQAFERHAGFDPHRTGVAALRAAAVDRGLIGAADFSAETDRDFWLDLWMSHRVSPALGREAPAFVCDFPASQAALARIRAGLGADDPPVAERFELFWRGIELANGYHELTDAADQRRRFEADQQWRRARQREVPPYDAHLVAALEHGLPDCSGVALGLDRLLMLKLGLADLGQTFGFAADRA